MFFKFFAASKSAVLLADDLENHSPNNLGDAERTGQVAIPWHFRFSERMKNVMTHVGTLGSKLGESLNCFHKKLSVSQRLFGGRTGRDEMTAYSTALVPGPFKPRISSTAESTGPRY